MKFFKTLVVLFTLTLFVSCAPKQIALNKSTYYAQDNVAVIIHPPISFVGKKGPQGLLDVAVTPQTKYKEGMKLLSESYDSKIYQAILDECERIYKNSGKKYIILDSIANLPTLLVNNKEVLSYQHIKDTYQVDQVQEITCTYGIVIAYYGFIETDKNTFVSINSVITELTKREKIQQYNQTKKMKLKGKWQANDYAIFRNSLESSVKLALKDFTNQF